MWQVLKKPGVPGRTIKLIQSFHNGMKASIRLDGNLLKKIKVQNGLR
jgi:hypothetical protein